MNKTYFALSLIGLIFNLSPAKAEVSCGTPPTCAELGYTKSAGNCSGKSIIKCPFDQSKVFCEDYPSCNTLGFTDTISECPGAYIKCPTDASKGKCDFEAAAGDLKYSLRTSNHQGWMLCNGTAYSSSRYPELYSAIGGIYGTTLPNYSGYFLKGAATSSLSKTAQAAGLPNITGTFANVGKDANNVHIADSSGAFYFDNWANAGYDGGKNHLWQGRALFNAALSNSIYGNSSTVTPQNYSVNIFIYSGRKK